MKKLASSIGPGDSASPAPEENPSSLLSTGRKKRYEAERQGGRDRGDSVVVVRPRKLEINLENSGISQKTVDIINSIRHSSSSSSIAEPLEGSRRFDNCKDFLSRSDAPLLFDATSTSTHKQNSRRFPVSKSISNLSKVLVESKGSLTEVHSGCGGGPNNNNSNSVSVGSGFEEVIEDEVEIVSLLEEQVPRYKLRADTITKFGGWNLFLGFLLMYHMYLLHCGWRMACSLKSTFDSIVM